MTLQMKYFTIDYGLDETNKAIKAFCSKNSFRLEKIVPKFHHGELQGFYLFYWEE